MIDFAKVPTLTASGKLHRYNPLSLVCEAIALAPALKSLSLANCQINSDEDFILEDAFAEKAGVPMEELNLSGNPWQGQQGARSLVRMVVTTSSLHSLDAHSPLLT